MTIYIVSTGLTHYGISVVGVFTGEGAAEEFALKQETVAGAWWHCRTEDGCKTWLDDADGVMTIEEWEAK